MIKPPDINDARNAVPEAHNLTFLIQGGFKSVYYDNINGKKEAIKLVRIPDDPSDPEIKTENLSRINREVDIIRRVKTDKLVKLGSIKPREEIINDETYFIYSEEFLDGENLNDIINKRYKPDQKELKELCKSLITCIIEFKNAPEIIVHRDIKPLNVIKTLDQNRKFVLIDLGIAFYTAGTHLTPNPNQVPGTRENLAPEYFDSNFRERIDYRADLYNAGLTIYEFATGEHPFRNRDLYITLANIQSVSPKPLITLRPELDKNFCEMIDSWLKKKPLLRESRLDEITKVLNS